MAVSCFIRLSLLLLFWNHTCKQRWLSHAYGFVGRRGTTTTFLCSLTTVPSPRSPHCKTSSCISSWGTYTTCSVCRTTTRPCKTKPRGSRFRANRKVSVWTEANWSSLICRRISAVGITLSLKTAKVAYTASRGFRNRDRDETTSSTVYFCKKLLGICASRTVSTAY